MEISQPASGSRPIAAEQRPSITPEKTVARVDPEVRRAIQRERDDPIPNFLSSAPLVEPVGLSAGEMRIFKMGGAILAVVIVAIVAFLVFGVWARPAGN